MATNNKDDINNKKTMDVSKPGKSTPDTSSRPVIVTHKLMQDPMVKSTEVTSDIPEKEETPPDIVSTVGSKVIQPLTPSESKPEEVDLDAKDEAESTQEETAADKTSSTSESADAAVVDAVVDQATADKKKKNELSDEEKKKREELQKLVQSKKYFVPVGQVTKRRKSRRLLLILTGVLLLLVGAYALVDAGIVKAGFDVPFDFIKNKSTISDSAVDTPATESPAAPANSETHTQLYTDTANTYTIEYPKNWSIKKYVWEDCCEGPAKTEPDWKKVPQPLTLVPPDAQKGVEITIGADKTGATTIDQVIDEGTKDQFNTYTRLKINGYDALYHLVDFVGPSEAEKYKDHEYVIVSGNTSVQFRFRERWSNTTLNGEQDFDASRFAPAFEALVKSIKLL